MKTGISLIGIGLLICLVSGLAWLTAEGSDELGDRFFVFMCGFGVLIGASLVVSGGLAIRMWNQPED